MSAARTKWFSISGLILIGIVIGVIFASNMQWTPTSLAGKQSGKLELGNTDSPVPELLQLQNTGKAFTVVSKELLPTVVSIATSKVVKRSNEEDEFWSPLFKDFFGKEFKSNTPQEQRLQGLGSGVIVSKEGYILTNHHVIQNADDITVTLYDKRQFVAKLVGTDPLTEVAVIKIEGDDLPVARLGNSDEMEIGEWVLAFGNPLNLTSTVTAGIVSAIGRSIGIIQDEDVDQTGGSYAIENFIQTDAAINPGNSGGPLVNLKAEVIGINTAIATRTGGYQGYGFAIPVNLARKIMTDLIEQGYVTRAWLGIGMREVDEAVAKRYNMDRPHGVRIDNVMAGSPAEKSGLKPLDIIVALDGKEMNHSNEIQNYIALKSPGDVVEATVLRDGKEKKLRLELGKRETGKEEETVTKSEDPDLPELGLQLRELDSELRSQLDYYKDDKGVVVADVEQYSAAFNANIRRGDLIVSIENDPVTSLSDYKKALKKYDKGQVVIFKIKRRTTEFHAFVTLPK